EWRSSTALFWALSPNYSNDFSSLPEGIDLISYSDASNEFSKSVFVHETTRSISTEGLNSKPSILIAGHYTIGSASAPETFYRLRTSIFKENEAYAFLLKKVSSILKINCTDITEETLKENFELKHIENIDGKELPSSYVTLQLREGKEISGFSGKDGVAYSDSESLNKAIAEKCGALEMFKDGKCLFSVPVEHKKFSDKTIYGIVRNHHYSISINSISGIGKGVSDENSEISETPEFEEDSNSYSISFELKIRDWTDITQDVAIGK
ncbi:MAG: Mfa1 fimbrilin C-terminal domain-containing protein, partial [Muribaculaceae bacterium]|nr:Mfa1 fimbrilin C-terminal domain-containing protein [Muribaculaceae bacterium]